MGCERPPIDRIICSAVLATVGEIFPRRAFTWSAYSWPLASRVTCTTSGVFGRIAYVTGFTGFPSGPFFAFAPPGGVAGWTPGMVSVSPIFRWRASFRWFASRIDWTVT